MASLLPELVAADAAIGCVTPSAAARFGLPAGIPVSPGGGDNMMAALGSGAVVPGRLVLSLGTSGTIFGRTDSPLDDPSGGVAPFCDSAGAFLPLVCIQARRGAQGRGRTKGAAAHRGAGAKGAAKGAAAGLRSPR